MLLSALYVVPIASSLAGVALLIGGSILFSLLRPGSSMEKKSAVSRSASLIKS
jgi:hypothetical protein